MCRHVSKVWKPTIGSPPAIGMPTLAEHEAARMLALSGPGTGKSTLFKGRLQYLMSVFPDHRVPVATFVGKLAPA